jgi:Glyoxalase-like domain
MSEKKPTADVDRRLPIGGEIFLDHVAHFVADPEGASRALARAGFAPTPISIQVNPDPAGGPPRPTGTGNVTCMLDRGYLEVLFRTSDTPLAREFDAAIAACASQPSRSRMRAQPMPGWRNRDFACSRSSPCSARSKPRPAQISRRLGWCASRRAKCPKAVSRR